MAKIYSTIVKKLFFRRKLAVKHVLTDFFELMKAPWNRQIQPDSKLKFIIKKLWVLHDFLTQYDQFDLGWHNSFLHKLSQIRDFSNCEFHIRIRWNQTISRSPHELKNVGSNVFYTGIWRVSFFTHFWVNFRVSSVMVFDWFRVKWECRVKLQK